MSEAKLREALEFYADPNRYNGANQRNDGTDKWSGDKPYIQDVTRDGGAIAREALAQPAEAVELTDEEIISMAKISFLCDFSPLPVARHQIIRLARAVIAAHEAKRSQS